MSGAVSTQPLLTSQTFGTKTTKSLTYDARAVNPEALGVALAMLGARVRMVPYLILTSISPAASSLS